MTALAEQTRWMDATHQAALVAAGEVTPSELLEAAIERIEQSNATLNAVVIEWFEHARSVAAGSGLPDGPFRGAPFVSEPPLPLAEFENNPDHPTAPMRRGGEFAAFTPPFNMSGQPAISLPLHRNADGLPVGVQLVAGYGREDVLIRVAAQLESAHPWESYRPAVP
ncbi:MAG: hypothetical protein K2X97_10605 [Mycobacteriaceae bacterium]|nr:hypothetical protein [Mycobacteriaceae bacterium]